jgi:Uma2 family endonuclease
MSTDLLPSLVHGERLSRDEFERRYEAMPDVRAELLDGVVYIMASPVSGRHGSPHFRIIGWLGAYESATEGVEGYDNTSLRLSPTAEPQPDGMLFVTEDCGGQTHMSADGYPEGSPELLIEVAVTSVSYDLNVKQPIYLRNGVREYIVWRVDQGLIDWFVLRPGRYESLAAGGDGILRSEAFPGLWLDPRAMVDYDKRRVREVSDLGLGSPEHARFVQQLELRRQARASGGATP